MILPQPTRLPANNAMNDAVQIKLESRFDQGAEELRDMLRAPGEAPRWVMDGCEALLDSVWDDVRDSLISYVMVEFGKSTGKYAEPRLGTPPDAPSASPCFRWLGRARAWVLYAWYLRAG